MTHNNLSSIHYYKIDNGNELVVQYPLSVEEEAIKQSASPYIAVRTDTGDLADELFGYQYLISIKSDESQGMITAIWSNKEVTLEESKNDALKKIDGWLVAELSKGMDWVDGKHYTITEKKQILLEKQLLIGLMKVVAGVAPENIILQWSDSGEIHEPYKYLVLVALSEAMHDKVEPLVVAQQTAEKRVKGATSNEEIQEVLQWLKLQGDGDSRENPRENAETEDEAWEDSVGVG